MPPTASVHLSFPQAAALPCYPPTAMSWQSYIDDQLLASGFCSAAIVGFDGTTWSRSPEYTVLSEEAVKLARLLGGEALDEVAGAGFTLAGVRYAFTRGGLDDDDGDPPFLHGRRKEERRASQGVIVVRCSTCLVVGVHEPELSNGRSFGQVNTDIGRLADYLMENGY